MSNLASNTIDQPVFAGESSPAAFCGRLDCNADIADATSVQNRNSQRFTLDGSAALEGELAALCAQVRTEVGALVPKSKLTGLLLAGGYGRGEGGILRTAVGDRPYNDLEFYVFIRGNAVLAERKYRTALHELGKRLSPAAELEVEFKVLTLDKLRRAAPSMFYYDLLLGHRWLVGDDSLLAGCQHHRAAAEIPLSEATRLLMNRCAGLLFSSERLHRDSFGADDADFVGRNLAKAQLAFGDVLLAAHGQYHWSCRVRHQRLRNLPALPNQIWAASLLQHHAAGVEFKLHPTRSLSSREELARQYDELNVLGAKLWLWLEQRRLQHVFATPVEYALSPLDKCAETSTFRNCLINARTFGLAAVIAPGVARYPRQRLMHALCLLLWEKDFSSSRSLLLRVQRELKTSANDFAGLVAAFETLWHRFN